MTAAKVVGVDRPTQVPLHVSEEHRGNSNPRARWTVYDAKRLGYEWLKSLPPLNSHFENGWNH